MELLYVRLGVPYGRLQLHKNWTKDKTSYKIKAGFKNKTSINEAHVKYF